MAERGQWASQWTSIAEQFPATLAKDMNAEVLEDGKTPDSFGLGIDRPGFLYYDSAPSSGTVWNGISTIAAPTNAPVTATWRFIHNRLFGFPAAGTTLYYGAYGYDSTYLLQNLGYIPVDSFESGNIVQCVPFGGNVAVFKTDCFYVVRNADNPGASLTAEYVKQSSGLPVTGNVIALDDKLYWANASGVFQYDGKNILELTEPIRNNLGTFASGEITTLRADFSQKKVVGRSASDTEFVIALGDNTKLYDYSTTGFKFETRTLVGEEGEPLLVDKIGFIYQYSTSEQATVDFGVKINDSWKNKNQLKIRPANDNGWAEMGLTNVLACRKFALRITNMSSGLYISKILIHVKQNGNRGYSAK